jgi:autotransporter-associated beta strand protein
VTLTGGTTNITKLADSGSNSSLGTGSSSAPIRMNGGTLSYTGTGGDTTNRAIEMVAGAAINNNGSGTIDFTAANVAQTGTASARTLTLGGTYTGGANTFGSIIGNSGTGANITSLVKNGNSTWILSNGNTYTGTTTVNAGTLALGANDVLPDNSAITMASGTLNAATFSDAVGTLDVTAAAVINLGTGGALAFADSSAVDWTGGTLNITGTLGATSIRFGTTSGGLTSGQLAVISVNGSGAGAYTLDADGYLVGGGLDTTPPTLTSITDNVSGGPVDIGATVTYTVTFNEDIDAASVTSADFNNNGTAGITVGAISETSAGVFTVAVTANSAGSLKLRIPTGAVIEDVALNDLVVPVEDDTTITVHTLFDTWANATYVPPLTMKLAGDDQDGDTFINLMEFAFGTQPTVSSSGSIVWVNGGAVTTPGQPVAINMANPGVDYRAVFGRRKDYAAAGLTYTVEFSAGLNVWVPSAATPTVLTGAGGLNASEIEAVSVPYPLLIDVGGNNFKKPTFFRLTISN